MNDACRYKIHGGVFEMLVETVIVAVANHGIGNRLSVARPRSRSPNEPHIVGCNSNSRIGKVGANLSTRCPIA